MDRLDGIRVFTRVAETGSFSQVAREINVGQPAISKQVASLESHLGVQLIHRTSRNVRLTDAGQRYYKSIKHVLADVEMAENLAIQAAAKPSGRLSVTLSAGFGRLQIVPLLPEFHERFPDISLDLIVADRFVDLVEEGIDLAIRIANLSDSSLIARRIGFSYRATVATPAYLATAGVPTDPTDLNHHACVLYTFQRSPNPWFYQTPEGVLEFQPSGRFRATDAENVRAGILSGLGIAQAPRWLFSKELASGELVVHGLLAQPDADPRGVSRR
ncbi:MAG: LysR family transcriptional regulator [Rhizobium sp.]|nr:MAG: LysR family transcriptional regulator [Rhizobium sp.]